MGLEAVALGIGITAVALADDAAFCFRPMFAVAAIWEADRCFLGRGGLGFAPEGGSRSALASRLAGMNKDA